LNKPRQPKKSGTETTSPPEPDVIDPVQTEIEKRLDGLLPPGERDEIIRRVVAVMHSESFSGPIAHPGHLREYELILPGAADRIIGMAEKQQDHIIAMERTVVEKEFSDRRWGMVLGALTFGLLIGGALAAGLNDKTAVALAFLGAAAIGGVGLFVNGRRDGK
jgi:uncharacterized membrane protein